MQKLTDNKQALLDRNVKIKKSYKNYVSLGCMKITAARQTAVDFRVSVSTVYLALKS